MNRTLPPGRARMAIAIICAAACCSCTYMLKFGNKPKFHPVNISGVTFTPAVKPRTDGPVLYLTTGRPNPVIDEISTIKLADITVTVVCGEDGLPMPVALQQDGDAEVLLESGDVRLAGRLSGQMPKDSPAESYDRAIITYQGQSATSYLQPAE